MKTLRIVLAFSLLASLGFQTNLLAQGPSGEPKGAPTAQELGQATTIEPSQVTDSMIDSFVRADRKIREVQIKANREIFQILDQEGLSVAKYNGIVQAISKDEKLLKKVQAKIEKTLQEEEKTPKA